MPALTINEYYIHFNKYTLLAYFYVVYEYCLLFNKLKST